MEKRIRTIPKVHFYENKERVNFIVYFVGDFFISFLIVVSILGYPGYKSAISGQYFEGLFGT